MYLNPRTYTDKRAYDIRPHEFMGDYQVIRTTYSGPTDGSGKVRIYLHNGHSLLLDGNREVTVNIGEND